MEIGNLNDQLMNLSNQSNNTIALLKQQLEATEKQLEEKIDALEKLGISSQQKLDQQYQLHEQERTSLNTKVEG